MKRTVVDIAGLIDFAVEQYRDYLQEGCASFEVVEELERLESCVAKELYNERSKALELWLIEPKQENQL